MDSQISLRTAAAIEVLRNQQHNLVETISRLVEIMNALPEGEYRDKLLEEISCLDVIVEVMRRALDAF
jgi:hypothetical protein